MYFYYPWLEIDIAAWLFLSYISGVKEIPTKEQMMEANELDLLNCMQDGCEYSIEDG